MNETQYTIEDITTQLATWLIDDYNISIQQALDKVFNSKIYTQLQDTTNGLIAQSDAYLYDCLCHEN